MNRILIFQGVSTFYLYESTKSSINICSHRHKVIISKILQPKAVFNGMKNMAFCLYLLLISL